MKIICNCKDTFELISIKEKTALFQCPTCRKSFTMPTRTKEDREAEKAVLHLVK